MIVWGVIIEIQLLLVASLVGFAIGVMVYWLQHRTLTVPKVIAFAIFVTLSLYYILNVVWGSGRTGWP